MENNKKARNWTAVLYPDSMIVGWQDRIYRQLQVPFEYIIHDKDNVEVEEDVLEPRKTHIHLVLHYTNTTTYNNVLSMIQDSLSSLGNKCCNKVEPVRALKYMHRYLTHDTEDCRKSGKYLYNVSDIITGNNWDLGAFIELEDDDKLLLYSVIRNFAVKHQVITFIDLEDIVEVGYFDDLLPEFDRPQIRSYLKNNERLFTSICKQIYFKKKLKEGKEP